MKKVFFFDRDGTLIKNIPYLNDASKIEYFTDTLSTLKNLKLLGYEFIIVTNQSGLARGLITIEQMTLIHKKIRADLSIHGIDLLDILYSPDGPNSDDNRRKPRTGMLTEAFSKFNINKKLSYMVGDNITDIQCANNFGLKSFFLNKDKIDQTIYIDKLSEIINHIKP